MSEHPELIALCTSCTRDECPENGCGDYRAIKRRLGSPTRADTPKAAPDAPVSAGCLAIVNRCVNALDELLSDAACQHFIKDRTAAARLLEQLKRTRFERCQHLIDWGNIAQQLEEDNHD